MSKRWTTLVVLGSILSLLGPLNPSFSDVLINGAGSTFIYPMFSKWFDVYAKEKQGVRFNYQSIGSGGGIRMLSNRTVDFGASDAPLTDQQLASAPGKILHFPMVLGADVVAYNLPGFTGTLKLTPSTIADIFMGNITKWDDEKIKQSNPGVAIPSADIIVAHRSDGSGTTYIFVDYLSKVSSTWESTIGRGTSVKWPVGLGGKGNEGVTALIQQTPGGIGYIELTYALNNKIPFATIQNQAGNWVPATLDGVTAAAASAAANMPDDFRVSITNAPGADAYPISSFTWMLVYKNQSNHEIGDQITKFLGWALTDGQKYAPDLKYAPLPAAVVKKETAQIQEIQVAP